MQIKKVAWGISGAGEKIEETINIMQDIQSIYKENVEIYTYISKSGIQVLNHYNILKDLKNDFEKVYVEKGPNTPFLAADLQIKKFEFFLIAPCTANTMAKLAYGIGDTLITNSALMGQKAKVNNYILPVDFKPGVTVTKLPNGNDLTLELTEEDVKPVKILKNRNYNNVFENTETIYEIFEKYFGK